MIKSRLLLLAERLEKIQATPKKKRTREFDMKSWVHKNKCGTAACAVGEATFIKRFRDLGLRYSGRHAGPSFKGHLYWSAVQKFFGITAHEATRLFAALYTNHDPGDVAASIRGFVEIGAI